MSIGYFNKVLFVIVGAIALASCSEDEGPSGSGEFRLQSGDASLAGTLELPNGTGPFPVVISVHGSGRTTRNNNSFIYENLKAEGIAVLKYDKRGVGLSSGEYQDVSAGNSEEVFDILASDVVAWVNFLATHQNINTKQIGLVGASQAGWIIPLAALKSEKVSFMINVVGPTVSVGHETRYSFLTNEEQFDDDEKVNGFTLSELEGFIDNYGGFKGYDPLPILKSLDIPGLWIFGKLDESIPTFNCAKILDELKQQSKPYSYKIFDDANHALINRNTGNRVPFMTEPGGGIDWLHKVIDNLD